MTEASGSDPDSQTIDLGPLTLARRGRTWCFTLTTPHEMTLELPPDYERALRRALEPLLEQGPPPEVVVDLQNLPGISSRHLGLMLALHKALGECCGRVRIAGASPAVRRLLDLTRTERFFELQ